MGLGDQEQCETCHEQRGAKRATGLGRPGGQHRRPPGQGARRSGLDEGLRRHPDQEQHKERVADVLRATPRAKQHDPRTAVTTELEPQPHPESPADEKQHADQGKELPHHARKYAPSLPHSIIQCRAARK